MRSAEVIPLRPHLQALAVQDLVRAERRRAIAQALATGCMRAVEVLVERAIQAGGLDYPGVLGLQSTVVGAKAAMAVLAEAEEIVRAKAGDISDD